MRLLLAVPFLLAIAPSASVTQDLEQALAFEASREGEELYGWTGFPRETVSIDGDNVHGGHWSARIQRDVNSARTFTSLGKSIPIDFAGKELSLRGFLRTENVDGWAGLWLRQDNDSGAVAFDNMNEQQLSGTTPWTQYRIDLPLKPDARELLFGALLSGRGTVWVDDLELLVDGRPLSRAPKRERLETAIDRDREFDSGSGIEAVRLSQIQVDNIVTLAKVWGFLKYHHPKVTAGEVHWDYELFRALPRILHSDDSPPSRVLLDWIEELGPIPACDPCAEIPEDLHLAPNLTWVEDEEYLGAELSSLLSEVYRNRHASGPQHYVSLHPVHNPDFSNERGYRDLAPPDAGYRLLALFRFWNIIQYWFPYRDVMQEDWEAVLAEFVPRLVAADSFDQYRLELTELIGRIHDGHASLSSAHEVRPPKGTCQLPVQLRSVEGRMVVVGYLHETAGPATGLLLGDSLLALDGTSVPSLVESWLPYYSASNESPKLRAIAMLLKRGECGSVVVRGERAARPFERTARRMPVAELRLRESRTNDLPGEPFRLLSDQIAYLKLSSVSAASTADYIRRAGDARGLIIDIRNYPSEFVVFALGQHLVRESTMFARFTHGDLANPGAFLWTEPTSLQPRPPHFGGKVVILVDESSMSQAEYTAIAFRAAPDAIVVGSTTAGADGDVSAIPLPGGLRTLMSGIGVFYPDKSPTQRVGILADVPVHPTVAGIREARDEILEQAIREILGDDVPEKLLLRLTAAESTRDRDRH